MNREYHKWHSSALRRDMELLVIGTGGTPVLSFPTSLGGFFASDAWSPDHIRRQRLVLATGENDICRDDNVRLSKIMDAKQIPHYLDVWLNGTGHDWPWWEQMAQKFL